MQTFAPLAGNVDQPLHQVFRPSLECLDYRRLGKQRIEVKQIVMALERGSGGWVNHPASLMWADDLYSLLTYGAVCCEVWIERGYRDNTLIWMVGKMEQLGKLEAKAAKLPWWWGNSAFHSRHRSQLLAKAPEFYAQYGWLEKPGSEYIWPHQLRRKS